jgi:hypothetical protein
VLSGGRHGAPLPVHGRRSHWSEERGEREAKGVGRRMRGLRRPLWRAPDKPVRWPTGIESSGAWYPCMDGTSATYRTGGIRRGARLRSHFWAGSTSN